MGIFKNLEQSSQTNRNKYKNIKIKTFKSTVKDRCILIQTILDRLEICNDEPTKKYKKNEINVCGVKYKKGIMFLQNGRKMDSKHLDGKTEATICYKGYKFPKIKHIKKKFEYLPSISDL